MDKMLSVHHKKATKVPKAKKKPVKVVYISNPMKVKTSASEFRALVQALTGQDADMPGPTRVSDVSKSVGGGGTELPPHEMKAHDDHVEELDDDHQHHVLNVPHLQYPGSELMQTRSSGSDVSFQTYDDDHHDILLMPQMLENFPGLFSSNSWYESTDDAHDHGEPKSHDAM